MLEYLAGVATPIVVCGLGLLGVMAFAHDGVVIRECGICDFATYRDRPIVRWIKWKWHALVIFNTPQHRADLDAYLRRMRRGKYAETRKGL